MNAKTSITPPGTKRNDYTVVEEVGGGMLLLQCACGSEPRKTKRSYFLSGRVKGCMECRYTRRPPAVAVEKRGIQQILAGYVASAEKRGIEFKLNFDEFRYLIFQDCYYCDSPPSNEKKVGKRHSLSYNGIDRMDSKGAYETSNVVTACRFCNYAKRERTTEEFMIWIRGLAKKYAASSN